LDCVIGGDAGDASPAAKLVASCCDNLLIHPNVVNASDINEMTPNMWYVEGSQMDRFLWGRIQLYKPRVNKILTVANRPIGYKTENAVNAARATIGCDIDILELNKDLIITSKFNKRGCATGDIKGWKELVKQVREHRKHHPFDALAIHTPVKIPREIEMAYYEDPNKKVNPMGGAEALASKYIADKLNMPVAHAPFDDISYEEDPDLFYVFDQVGEPTLAAEFISTCYLHCVLKGLWKAPRIGPGLSFKDIDFMVSPYGCHGQPHNACLAKGIPVIVVKENTCILKEKPHKDFILVDSYLEALGVIQAMKIGISPKSVKRPLDYAPLYKNDFKEVENEKEKESWSQS